MLCKQISLIAILSLLILFSNMAFAQSDFYVFGAFSTTDSDLVLSDLTGVNDSDNGFSLGAGYAVTPNFSLEAAYQDFGSPNGGSDCPPEFFCLVIPVSTKADITGLSLSLVGNLPITDKFDLYGKIGLVGWDIDFSGISTAFDDSGEDFLFGAGLRLSIDDHWKAFVEYQKLDLDLKTASIGIGYKF